MEYKIGDIVRYRFMPDKTGIIFGYALGCAFAPPQAVIPTIDMQMERSKRTAIRIFFMIVSSFSFFILFVIAAT